MTQNTVRAGAALVGGMKLLSIAGRPTAAAAAEECNTPVATGLVPTGARR